jgi:ribosomal protein S6--L-glutamate ligase
MNTLLVVNGEPYWQEYFPGHQVQQRRLQSARWLYHEDHLWLVDGGETLRVEAVLWRVGAIRPQPNHRAALELIRLAGVPCLNPAATLLRGFDRLSMLNEMREAGLPVIPYSAAVGDQMMEKFEPELPAIVKIGNYHAGFGKARAADAAQWRELADLSFISQDYLTVEPYIDYAADIRCLTVGRQMWAMTRRGAGWKANAGPVEYQVIEPPDILAEYTNRAMAHLGADILGLDFLEDRQGGYVLLESNDVPGLSGFPEEVIRAVAQRMREKMA